MKTRFLLLCSLFWFAANLTSCKSPAPPEPQSTPQEETISDKIPEKIPEAPNTMMIPDNALHTTGGYPYIVLNPGSGMRPSPKSAVDIHIRALDLEGKTVDEADGTIAVAHSTPMFEDLLSVMGIGETIRVWGTAEGIVMDLTLVSENAEYSAPSDVAAPPPEAALLPGYDDIHWKIIEPGNSTPISVGAALRVKGTRWKTDGEILESNLAGRGLLIFMTPDQEKSDPIHHTLFQQMTPGMHARIWIPGHHEPAGIDVVEDFWIAEELTQLETPANCKAPAESENPIIIEDTVRIVFSGNRAENKFQTGNAAEVDMTCWNTDTETLIDASYLREKHDIMDIGPDLGIWEKIMMEAGHGDSFTVWIPQDKLPETVNMPLTCRVRVF